MMNRSVTLRLAEGFLALLGRTKSLGIQKTFDDKEPRDD